MKKSLLIVLMALVSVCMMAQPPRGGHGHHDRDGHGHRPGSHQVECATQEQLQKTLQVIGKQSFEEKKLEMAELCACLCTFCTNDLARIARKFAFDEHRRKFLTYAYDYCSDPYNYYTLREVFEFRNNFDEMMRQVEPPRR